MHGGESGGNNDVVAEEELARSVIRVGFEWIRELKKCEHAPVVELLVGCVVALTCMPRWEQRPVE